MEIIINVDYDYSCHMARVYDNLGNGMGGNFWDFHNGCHGLYEFGIFNSLSEFIKVLSDFHVKNKNSVTIIMGTFKYAEL